MILRPGSWRRTVSSPTPDQTAAGRAFVNANLTPTTADVAAVLAAARTDAYVTGLLVAAQQTGASVISALGDVQVPTTAADWASFWDSWSPGSVDAANLTADGGLSRLLDSVNIDVKGITGSTLDGLGNTLARSLADGSSVDEAASALMDYVNSPARAFMIANTETARAVTQASVGAYRADGVTRVEWLDSPGACDECMSYAGQTYPIDDAPDLPAHPNCRCSFAPVDPGSPATEPGE